MEWDYEYSQTWNSEVKSFHAVYPASDTVYSFAFVGSQRGRWRVWAVNAQGVAGAKSEWRTFLFTR